MIIQLAALSQFSVAQENNVDIRYHSIEVKAGHFFIIEDSTHYISKDTVFYIADTVDYYQTRKKTPEKANNFFKSFATKMYKNKVTRWVYKRLFRFKKKKKEAETKVAKSEDQYLQYQGKVIGDINLKYLEIFGTDVDDTTKHSKKSFIKFMNGMHVHTGNKIIAHQLLLSEGYLLHPSELADNERVIRQLPYIKDARIYVGASDQDDYKVNLDVVTRDVFPLKFDVNPGGLSGDRFGFSNINLFGTGHELETSFIINDKQDGSFGHEYYYRMPNLKGTFITSEFNYANSFNKEGFGVRAFRDFITPDLKYAGGGGINIFRKREIRLPNGQLVPSPSQLQLDSGMVVSFKEFEQDIWVGRSYRSFYSPPIERVKERLRLLFAARINRVKYIDRPDDVDQNTNFRFHHRTRFLGSVGFSSRRYYKDRLIKSFGRTEDIPAGNLVQFTGGYEVGEFVNRFYVGTKATKGGFIHNFGYLKGELQLGGFYNRQGHFEQGVVETKLNYFTHLYTLHFFKIRQFFDLNYTLGVRRLNNEVLDINGDNGLRGFNTAFIAGTQRLSLKSETVVFTPLYITSFRVAFFGFFDLGFLNSNQDSPFSGELYSSLGGGVRLRNENLAFGTIQFRLAYYPNAPIDEDNRKFSFATKPVLALDDFDLREPEVLEFR